MSNSRPDRFNLNNYRQGAVRPPGQVSASTAPPPMHSLSPVDAREDMNAANNFLEARFREARDVPKSGMMAGAPRGTETELHERRRSSSGASAYPHPGPFPQENSTHTRAEIIELAPRRVPESVQAFRQSREYEHEQRRTSTSSGQLQHQQIQQQQQHHHHQQKQQQQQQLYYQQHEHHMPRRQSSSNEHHVQHSPQLNPPVQHHVQPPVHYIQHPQTVPNLHVPVSKQSQIHAHPISTETSMFQMILERLDHIVERQNVAALQRKSLFHDVNEVKSALGVLAAGSPSHEKPTDRILDGAYEKGKEDGNSEEGNAVNVQKGTLRCLTSLVQRVSEIAAVVNVIEDTLGPVDVDKGGPALRKGKMRAFASSDVAFDTSSGADSLVRGDGSSAENRIDVDALDEDEDSPVVSAGPSRNGLSQRRSSIRTGLHISPVDSRRRSVARIKGRSVMERLDSQQSIIMDIAEWMEKMKDPHADLSADPHTSTRPEERDTNIGESQPQVASSKPSPYQTSMAPPPGRIYSHNSTPSRPGSIGSLSQGGTIHIHIDDNPAVASAAHKPSNSLDDALLKPQPDGLPIAGQPHGPVVRLFATGSAGVQLLDLAKTIAEAGSGATIRNPATKGAADNMVLDVFESRPNLQGNNSDSDRESSKRSDSSKTLVSEPTGQIPSSSSSLFSHPKTTRIDTLPTNVQHQSSGLPTIKIKLSPRIANSTNTFVSSPSKSHSAIYSAGSPSSSTSQSKAAPTFSPSKFAASTTATDDGTSTFRLSPAVWTRSPSGSGTQALPFDLAELPTTATPTRSVRILRSSASRRSSMPGLSPSAAPATENPSDALRTPRTPRRMVTLPTSTPARIIDANWSSRLKTEIQATEIATAQRAIEGLLDIQAHTPTKEYSFEATNARNVETNPVTPIKIKIPARHPPSRNKTRNTPKQEEDVVKKAAERALKGLLKAQAVSPSKQYSIDSSIVPEVEETNPPQILLPTSNPTFSQDTTSMSITPNKPDILPVQPEGTISTMRLQDLGHPFVYAGVRVESLQQETQMAEEEGDQQPHVSPLPQDVEMAVFSSDQPEMPFGSTFMEVDRQIEEPSIKPPPASSEQAEAIEVSKDGVESYLANTSGTDEQVPETALPVNIESDAPMVSTTTMVTGDSEHELDLANAPVSTSIERRSQGLSDLSALTPAPGSEAHITAPSSRAASITPPLVDADPGIPDVLQGLDMTPPTMGGSRSSTPIDRSTVVVNEPKRQRTLSSSSGPTIVLEEPITEKLEDSVPQLDERVDDRSTTEEKEVIQPPSTGSSSVSATQSTSHDPVPIAPTVSQVSNSSEDEHDVQNLLGLVSSTPIGPSADLGQETSELDAAAHAVEKDIPKTPTRAHAPMIASSYSPEDMRSLHQSAHTDLIEESADILEENAEIFGESADVSIPGISADREQVSTEEPARSPTPPVNSAQTEEIPSSDDVYLGIVDSSPPPVEVTQPESTTDDVLDPEDVLHVKQELDNSTNGLLAAGIEPAAADKGKQRDSANNMVEPAYIYISDTDKTPVNRPSKRRAPSVIYISSDDDAPLSQLRSTAKSTRTSERGRSVMSGAIDGPTDVLAIKAEDISGIFAGMNSTSTPVRGRTREVSQAIPNRQPERSASPAAASVDPSRHLLTKELSPVSDLSKSPSPNAPAAKRKDEREATEPSESAPPINESSSVAELKKYIAKIDSDDDIPIIPRKKRKVSAVSEVPTEEGSTRNTPAESSSAPRKGMLVVPKKGKSIAVTRVRKRKLPTVAPESEEEDQPPLKMAKLRKKSKENDTSVKATGSESKGKGTVSAGAKNISAGAKSKGKMREQPARSPAKKVKVETPKTPPRSTRGKHSRAVKWPHIDRPNFDQFIQCDICANWYHVGCVGVSSNDPRLDDSRTYKCPPCEAGVSSHDSESPHKNTNNDDPQVYTCSRPKCQRTKKPKKKKTSNPEPPSDGSNTYVVEAFIGRFSKVVGGRGKQTFYLVKWHGYPPEECTWEELSQMGIANASTLIETFEQVAEAEGLELEHFSDEQALLQEAVKAGWRDTVNTSTQS